MLGLKQSPWLIHYDASSCNGCDIETLACLTPLFDVERLGVVNTGNPKHADIFLVTGAVNEQSRDGHPQHLPPIARAESGRGRRRLRVHAAAFSAIATTFAAAWTASIPVDVYVPGCAARPEAIIDGVVKALGCSRKSTGTWRRSRDSIDKMLYLRADKSDAPEILALQKIAYQSEAEIYGDDSLPALQQTSRTGERLRAHAQPEASCWARAGAQTARDETDRIVFLKAVVNSKIIGSVRGYALDDTAHVSRMMVHPYFRGRGIGRRLLDRESSRPSRRRGSSRPLRATRANATCSNLKNGATRSSRRSPSTRPSPGSICGRTANRSPSRRPPPPLRTPHDLRRPNVRDHPR